MRRALALSVSVGLAAVGSQVAHELAYRLTAPDAGRRADVLAESGHGYLGLVPLGLALLTVVVLLGLVLEGRSAAQGAVGARPRLWPFLAIAPATFACQEHFERLLHDGAVPWSAAAEPSFLVGLALQVPFALAAYALARLLVSVAVHVGRRLGRTPLTRALVARPGWAVVGAAVAPTGIHPAAFGARGPPLPAR